MSRWGEGAARGMGDNTPCSRIQVPADPRSAAFPCAGCCPVPRRCFCSASSACVGRGPCGSGWQENLCLGVCLGRDGAWCGVPSLAVCTAGPQEGAVGSVQKMLLQGDRWEPCSRAARKIRGPTTPAHKLQVQGLPSSPGLVPHRVCWPHWPAGLALLVRQRGLPVPSRSGGGVLGQLALALRAGRAGQPRGAGWGCAMGWNVRDQTPGLFWLEKGPEIRPVLPDWGVLDPLRTRTRPAL